MSTHAPARETLSACVPMRVGVLQREPGYRKSSPKPIFAARPNTPPSHPSPCRALPCFIARLHEQHNTRTCASPALPGPGPAGMGASVTSEPPHLTHKRSPPTMRRQRRKRGAARWLVGPAISTGAWGFEGFEEGVAGLGRN